MSGAFSFIDDAGARTQVEAGSLMSYGPNWLDQWRRAADMSMKFCAARNPATWRPATGTHGRLGGERLGVLHSLLNRAEGHTRSIAEFADGHESTSK